MSKAADNRRRYFRIVDSLGVSYRVILPEKGSDDDPEKRIDTLSILNHHNTLIQEQLGVVESESPEIAKLAGQLNKKIDAVLMMLELDNLMTQHACHRIDQASISASGIAFPVEEVLAPNTMLELDLLLRPSAKHVVAIGEVIACDRMSDTDTYYLRVNFTKMTDASRETLIQHIVQRQGVLLRALKGIEEDESDSGLPV
ncbi:MAG: succinate dehydrogenase flavin-adding protein (antitoxin of CptAB toxin-antitoxin module) [Granulosicoccus sp.]|jgi:succinate dehydrogenase flavin-adding protein (antitoxin of CptAB toxin-antitoxin module)